MITHICAAITGKLAQNCVCFIPAKVKRAACCSWDTGSYDSPTTTTSLDEKKYVSTFYMLVIFGTTVSTNIQHVKQCAVRFEFYLHPPQNALEMG
jgi:hypothetical protein